MRKAAFVALIASAVLAGCVPQETKPPKPSNILDGGTHRFIDIQLTALKTEYAGDSFRVELRVDNVSDGKILVPITEIDAYDNFGNRITIKCPELAGGNSIGPGEFCSYTFAGTERIATAKDITIELNINVSKKPNAVYITDKAIGKVRKQVEN